MLCEQNREKMILCLKNIIFSFNHKFIDTHSKSRKFVGRNNIQLCSLYPSAVSAHTQRYILRWQNYKSELSRIFSTFSIISALPSRSICFDTQMVTVLYQSHFLTTNSFQLSEVKDEIAGMVSGNHRLIWKPGETDLEMSRKQDISYQNQCQTTGMPSLKSFRNPYFVS